MWNDMKWMNIRQEEEEEAKKFTDTIARHQRANNNNSDNNVSVYLYTHLTSIEMCVRDALHLYKFGVCLCNVYAVRCEFSFCLLCFLPRIWPLYNTLYYAHKHTQTQTQTNTNNHNTEVH